MISRQYPRPLLLLSNFYPGLLQQHIFDEYMTKYERSRKITNEDWRTTFYTQTGIEAKQSLLKKHLVILSFAVKTFGKNRFLKHIDLWKAYVKVPVAKKK